RRRFHVRISAEQSLPGYRPTSLRGSFTSRGGPSSTVSVGATRIAASRGAAPSASGVLPAVTAASHATNPVAIHQGVPVTCSDGRSAHSAATTRLAPAPRRCGGVVQFSIYGTRLVAGYDGRATQQRLSIEVSTVPACKPGGCDGLPAVHA